MADVVLATTSSFGKQNPGAIETLSKLGFQVVTNPHGRKLTEEELVELIKQHQPKGLLAGTEPVTAKAMDAGLPNLKVISRIGVGWDSVDHDAAAERSIPVLRTEGVLDASVTELTLGFILSALRNIALQDREMRNGTWKKHMGGLLTQRTVGIVGFGSIGKSVGRVLKSLGAAVIYADPITNSCSWAECMSMDELLDHADIVTLHASGNVLLLGEKELKRFAKPGAGIVNTARGGMVNEEALFNLLSTGEIAWACLDVFENEPYTGPLLELDNVILSPHIGSYAKEARIRMEEMAVDNLLSALDRA